MGVWAEVTDPGDAGRKGLRLKAERERERKGGDTWSIEATGCQLEGELPRRPGAAVGRVGRSHRDPVLLHVAVRGGLTLGGCRRQADKSKGEWVGWGWGGCGGALYDAEAVQ